MQLAENTETGEIVAIKFLERGGSASRRIIARELLNHRECALHPNIVQLKVRAHPLPPVVALSLLVLWAGAPSAAPAMPQFFPLSAAAARFICLITLVSLSLSRVSLSDLSESSFISLSLFSFNFCSRARKYLE